MFLLPFAAFAVLMVVKSADIRTYRRLLREDGVIESLTAIFFFLSALLALAILPRLRRVGARGLFYCYVLFVLLLVFMAGEEISWGQRLLGIRTPDFFMQNSFQFEINVHNLKQVRDLDPFFAARVAIVFGAYGSIGWLLAALARRLPGGEVREATLRFLVPPWYASGFFLSILAYYYYLLELIANYRVSLITFKEQEVLELYLALGFLVFMIDACLRASKLLPR